MDALRKQLIEAMKGGHAHATFEEAVRDLPAELRGRKPAGAPHTAWQLLEHLRIAQSDILEFSRDGGHQSPEWPSGYWPAQSAPPSETAWDESVRAFERDQVEFIELLQDPNQDLMAAFPHGDGQTLLREALLVIDHNAYHVGQLITLRALLGAWK